VREEHAADGNENGAQPHHQLREPRQPHR
jgi:hypothetical protein